MDKKTVRICSLVLKRANKGDELSTRYVRALLGRPDFLVRPNDADFHDEMGSRIQELEPIDKTPSMVRFLREVALSEASEQYTLPDIAAQKLVEWGDVDSRILKQGLGYFVAELNSFYVEGDDSRNERIIKVIIDHGKNFGDSQFFESVRDTFMENLDDHKKDPEFMELMFAQLSKVDRAFARKLFEDTPPTAPESYFIRILREWAIDPHADVHELALSDLIRRQTHPQAYRALQRIQADPRFGSFPHDEQEAIDKIVHPR